MNRRLTTKEYENRREIELLTQCIFCLGNHPSSKCPQKNRYVTDKAKRCLTTKEYEILIESLLCKLKYHAVTPETEKKIEELKILIFEMRCKQ